MLITTPLYTVLHYQTAASGFKGGKSGVKSYSMTPDSIPLARHLFCKICNKQFEGLNKNVKSDKK